MDRQLAIWLVGLAFILVSSFVALANGNLILLFLLNASCYFSIVLFGKLEPNSLTDKQVYDLANIIAITNVAFAYTIIAVFIPEAIVLSEIPGSLAGALIGSFVYTWIFLKVVKWFN